jgi:hypothetical protein
MLFFLVGSDKITTIWLIREAVNILENEKDRRGGLTEEANQ